MLINRNLRHRKKNISVNICRSCGFKLNLIFRNVSKIDILTQKEKKIKKQREEKFEERKKKCIAK